MKCLNRPPRNGSGPTKRFAFTENFDSEAMSGRTYAKEAALAPAMKSFLETPK